MQHVHQLKNSTAAANSVHRISSGFYRGIYINLNTNICTHTMAQSLKRRNYAITDNILS